MGLKEFLFSPWVEKMPEREMSVFVLEDSRYVVFYYEDGSYFVYGRDDDGEAVELEAGKVADTIAARILRTEVGKNLRVLKQAGRISDNRNLTVSTRAGKIK